MNLNKLTIVIFIIFLPPLLYNKTNNPKTTVTDLFKHRLQSLYLINEILATKNPTFIDGLMETFKNEPCNLHILISLTYETCENRESHEKIQKLIQVWYRGKFLPDQALDIFSRTDENWREVLGNWLEETENMLPMRLKEDLDEMVDNESRRLNKEMEDLQEENKETIFRLNEELRNLRRKFGNSASDRTGNFSGRAVSPPRKRRYSNERENAEQYHSSSKNAKSYTNHEIEDYNEMQIDSDDESLKTNLPFHKTPAALMLKLIPIEEFDVTKPINENQIKNVVNRGNLNLDEIFNEFYSTSSSSKRDKFGWSPVTEKYSLYHFLKEKKKFRK